MTRTCRRCEATQPLERFDRQKGGRDGRRSVCKGCRAAARAANPERHRKVCEACGAQYVTGRREGRVCSLACRWFIDPMAPKVEVVPWAVCVFCRSWFTTRGGRRVCPQRGCQTLAWYPPWPQRTVECATCGSEFEARQGPARFCSDVCHRASPAFKAGRRRLKRRRKAQQRGGERVPYRDADIFERDRWRCRLCGRPVHRSQQVPHPQAATIDHIVPVAQGGADAPWNVQCAHFLCNSRKGDRTVDAGEQMMLTGVTA